MTEASARFGQCSAAAYSWRGASSDTGSAAAAGSGRRGCGHDGWTLALLVVAYLPPRRRPRSVQQCTDAAAAVGHMEQKRR